MAKAAAKKGVNRDELARRRAIASASSLTKSTGNGKVSILSRTDIVRFTADDPAPANRYAGVEVELNLDVPMGVFLQYQKLTTREGTADDLLAIFDDFGDRVMVSWNLTDAKGHDLPCDGEGLKQIPPFLAGAIIGRWTDLVVSVPAPLGPKSSATDTSD